MRQSQKLTRHHRSPRTFTHNQLFRHKHRNRQALQHRHHQRRNTQRQIPMQFRKANRTPRQQAHRRKRTKRRQRIRSQLASTERPSVPPCSRVLGTNAYHDNVRLMRSGEYYNAIITAWQRNNNRNNTVNGVAVISKRIPSNSCRGIAAGKDYSYSTNVQFSNLHTHNSFSTVKLSNKGIRYRKHLIYHNSVRIGEVDKRNRLRIKNSLHYSTLSFANGVVIRNSIVYPNNVAIHKLLHGHSYVIAECLSVRNALSTSRLHARQLQVAPLSDTVFKHDNVARFAQADGTRQVVNNSLHIDELVYALVRNIFVQLASRSRIRHTSYVAGLTVSDASDMLLMSNTTGHICLHGA